MYGAKYTLLKQVWIILSCLRSIMMKTFKNLKIHLCILLVLTVLVSLCGCFSLGGSDVVYSKEELTANISETSSKTYDYACDYFDKWNFPRFDKSKIKAVENCFYNYSVFSLPEIAKHAELAALYFLDNYYDVIDLESMSDVTDALLRSITATAGDEYAVYRSAEEYEDYVGDLSGEFVGIGVEISMRVNNFFEILRVIEESGAEDAGILAGDILHKVDGISAGKDNYDKVLNLLDGEVGSTVSVTVLRDGQEITFSVVRSKINDKTVSYTLDANKIGYIKISSFKANTAEQFRAAINYMEDNDAEGIVFDLRNNLGGYLNAVVDCLDYLVPMNKKIVSYRTKSSADVIYRSKTSHYITLPCVVLCNENTASAGELFVAAMRDYNTFDVLDVRTVGKVTFGKGVMQNTYSMKDGSSITLTMAYYTPPSDVNYHGVGVTPDIKVEQTEAEGDEQLNRAMSEIEHLTDLYGGRLSKEDLLLSVTQAMQTSGAYGYKYITSYLRKWGMPIFDSAKLHTMHDQFIAATTETYDVKSVAKETILHFIENYYSITDMSNKADYTNGLINSWLASIDDEWAVYRTENEYKDFSSELSGKLVGIGITLDKDTHKIVQIIKDSDSHGKLRVGDTLYAVNGIEYTEKNYGEILGELAGKEGTKVVIEVLREGEEYPIQYILTRRLLTVQSVVYTVIPGTSIGYVEITSFRNNTEDQFKDAINELEKLKVEGYIFDLRSNLGGSLSGVVNSISHLVEGNQTIVSFEYINGESRAPYKSTNIHSIGSKPCVVLCNEYTTAAGELFVAALRDYSAMKKSDGTPVMNAKIVGVTTQGKGVMQETKSLYDGTAITFTVAYFYPPRGKDFGFNGTGITPDVIVEADNETKADEQYDRALVEIQNMLRNTNAD